MSRKTSLFAVALSALLVPAFSASAVSIPLTGGDAADGYVAPASAVVAYDLAGSGVTVQGITFVGAPGGGPFSAPGGITVTTNGSTPFGQSVGSPFSGSADDNAMGSLLDTQAYGFFGAVTFTISGLANGVYRVDQFFYATDSGGAGTFSINGAAAETGPSNNGPYVNEQLVTVTAGSIVISDNNGSAVVRLNGFAVSQVVSVPEPSSIGLLAIGGVGILCKASRRRKVVA